MAKTDAQWQAFLLDSKQPKCTLSKLTFLGGGGGSGTEANAYLSDYIYASVVGGVHQRWDCCIVEAPTITESMSENFTGKSEQTFSNLVIKNYATKLHPEGIRNAWLSMNWAGRRYVQYLGNPSWDFADFRVVLDGVLGRPFISDIGEMSFPITDKSALLDRDFMVELIAGSEASANEPRPFAAGTIYNATPKLLDSSAHSYMCGHVGTYNFVSAQSMSIFEVYAAGISLSNYTLVVDTSNPGTDTLTTATPHGLGVGDRVIFSGGQPGGLSAGVYYYVRASGLTATAFQLENIGGSLRDITDATAGGHFYAFKWHPNTLGTGFTLSTAISGDITCDLSGITHSGGYTILVTDIIKEIFRTDTLNVLSSFYSMIDQTNLTAFALKVTADMGLFVTEKTSFAEVVDKIIVSVNSWSGFDPATGLMIFGRLDLPTGVAVYSFDSGTINDWSLKRELSLEPKAKVTILAGQNQTVQNGGQLAAAVTEARKAQLALEYTPYIGAPTITGYTDNPASHLLAVYQEEQQTVISSALPAQNEANRLATLYQQPSNVWSFETGPVAFILKRGDEVYITSDEFTGYGIVVHLEKRIDELSVVKFWAPETTTYPTGDLNV